VVGLGLADPLEHGAGHLHRRVVEAGLHAPGSVDAGAGVDERHVGARQLQQITRAEADVLVPDVARRLIGDATQRLAEVALHLLLACEVIEILHQVLGRLGDALGLGRPEQTRVLLLEHQRAGGSRHHHRRAAFDVGQQVGDVAFRVAPRRLHVAGVGEGHAAAALVAEFDTDVAVLEHDGGGTARDRIVVVDAASGEEHDVPVLAASLRRALREPAIDGLGIEGGLHPVPVDDERLLHHHPRGAILVGEVHERRREGADLSDEIGARGEASREGNAVAPGAGDLLAAHQRREVHVPFVRRGVGTVVVTELAVVTELVHLIEAGHRDARHFFGARVDQLEELRERGAQGQAAPALVTDVARAA
jgi:hypothetical protein